MSGVSVLRELSELAGESARSLAHALTTSNLAGLEFDYSKVLELVDTALLCDIPLGLSQTLETCRETLCAQFANPLGPIVGLNSFVEIERSQRRFEDAASWVEAIGWVADEALDEGLSSSRYHFSELRDLRRSYLRSETGECQRCEAWVDFVYEPILGPEDMPVEVDCPGCGAEGYFPRTVRRESPWALEASEALVATPAVSSSSNSARAGRREEREIESALQLLPLVSKSLSALGTYVERLGDDAGVAARMNRSSHFTLLSEPLRALESEWVMVEPTIHDVEVRRRFLEARFGVRISPLKKLSNSAHEEWDSTVLSILRDAELLDAALRRIADAPAPSANTALFRIPGYELVELIGHGGFGQVWEAKERSPLAKRRAVKVLDPSCFQDPIAANERFVREARALIPLNHPSVVRYVATGITEGFEHRQYLIMELVAGRNLQSVAGALPFRARVQAVAEVLDGLAYIHAAGLVHRDVKPSNVVVRETDSQTVLVDFGLVSAVDVDSSLTRTSPGTPGYIAPEALSSAANSRFPAYDIYSTGISLYEVLAGRKPNILDYQFLAEEVEELAGLDSIVQKAIAKVGERFESATEFALALREWLEGKQPSLDKLRVAEVQTEGFRNQLSEAADAIDDGNLPWAVVAVAGVYEAVRICWARSARRIGGLDLDGRERFLPATMSTPALALFSEIRGYCLAPKLAEDVHGPPSIRTMGFGATEQERLQRYVRMAEKILEEKSEQFNSSLQIEMLDLQAALRSLVGRLLDLEAKDQPVFNATEQTV